MAHKKTITFDIDEFGAVTLGVEGAIGAECAELTKDIENALGVKDQRVWTSNYVEETQAMGLTNTSADYRQGGE